MGISEDRWTCPHCNRTIVLRLRDAGREGLRAAQERHAIEHNGGNYRPATVPRVAARSRRGHPFRSTGA